MAKGMPSMVALLGLLAMAGYQNRDKIGSVLGGLGTDASGSVSNGSSGGLGGLLGNAGGGSLGSVLSGGLGDLLEHFNGNGQREKAQSWVTPGANAPIAESELEQTLGADTIASLQEQTGLSKQELLDRLSKTLPQAVDRLTPEGRLPTEDEASRLI